MSYTAPNRSLMPMRHSIDTFTLTPILSPNFSGTWPSANLAVYLPVLVHRTSIVRKLWVATNTTGTGNVDLGVFNAAGTRLVSTGATAHGTSGVELVIDITDTTIGPGRYYIGCSASNATDTFYRGIPAAPISLALGVYTEASAHPLPATATFAADQTLAFVPIIGMLLEATVA